MSKYAINIQLAPPNMNRQNSAEQAIQPCKNYFIPVFSTTDPDFHISTWYRLLFQCLITLNLVCNARFNPDISVHSYLYAPYHFNRYPMALPGTHVVIHDKPGNHTPWGHHGISGW